MLRMAKKKPTPDEQPQNKRGKGKPRYPSRENLRYVAIPKAMHELLVELARRHSDEDEEKSISWAARRIMRKGFIVEGMWPSSDKPDT